VLILPYMEGDHIYRQYKFDEPWDGPNNRKLAELRPVNLAFPQSPKGAVTTNYLAVTGPGTAWPLDGKVGNKDISDALENTILLVENSGAGVHWMEPRDLHFDTMDFTIRSPRGLSSLYGDPAIVTANDQVYRLNRTLKPDVLRAMLTIRGGEDIHLSDGGDWEFLPRGRK
jgi:hypothetical protein